MFGYWLGYTYGWDWTTGAVFVFLSIIVAAPIGVYICGVGLLQEGAYQFELRQLDAQNEKKETAFKPVPLPNLNTNAKVYDFEAAAVRMADKAVTHWAVCLLNIHRRGYEPDLTEGKWSGKNKLFSQPKYRWVKYYLEVEKKVLDRDGNGKTAPHIVTDWDYVDRLARGRERIPDPPKGWK